MWGSEQKLGPQYKRGKGKEILDDAKQGIHELLASYNENRQIDESNPHLQAVCLAIERVLTNGIKDKSSFWGGERDFWNYMEKLQGLNSSAADSIKTIRELSHIKTVRGRGRAFIRVALMEKKLEEYLRIITKQKSWTEEWYLPWAILRDSEQVQMFLGMLASLSIIDFSLCVKDTDFDSSIPISPAPNVKKTTLETKREIEKKVDNSKDSYSGLEKLVEELRRDNKRLKDRIEKKENEMSEEVRKLQLRIQELENIVSQHCQSHEPSPSNPLPPQPLPPSPQLNSPPEPCSSDPQTSAAPNELSNTTTTTESSGATPPPDPSVSNEASVQQETTSTQ